MSDWENESTEALIECLLSLKNRSEMKRFLRDLLTEQEIVEFGKRWKAANLLDQNVPYTEIEAQTGLSSATVARISKWLKRGMGGYKLALARKHKQN